MPITVARQTSTVRRKDLIRSSPRGRQAGSRSSCSKVNRTPPERQRPRLSMARPRLSLTSARDPSRLHTRGGSAVSSPAAAETNVRQILCRASHFGNRHRHRSHGRQTRVGPGGMWPCPRCRAGPRSPFARPAYDVGAKPAAAHQLPSLVPLQLGYADRDNFADTRCASEIAKSP
jgi:hypothetical protein